MCNTEMIQSAALLRLLQELKKGDECTEIYSADEVRKLLRLDNQQKNFF